MEKHSSSRVSELFGNLGSFIRICIFRVLSMGPIPNHFAFIMDGNRRYAKKENMEKGAGHRAGFLALLSILKYCYELGVKYVTIYAFSIHNFKRSPDEVKDLMDLMLEKIEDLLRDESIVNQYGIRVYFIGNLKLLSETVRIAAEKVMKATAKNTNCTLLICVAYTSRDEIVHAVQGSCKNKQEEIQPLSFCKANNDAIEEVEDNKKVNEVIPFVFLESQKDEAGKSQATMASVTCSCLARGVEGGGNKNSMVVRAVRGSYEDKWDNCQAMMENRTGNGVTSSEESENLQGECSIIKLVDIEKQMYMAVAPEPDILIRSSGESRLSNFLLWQTSECQLYSPDALWPEIGLWHLVWAVLNFQRNHAYLEKKKHQL
nr:cis-prenyltransferase [Hevea brasiliensis]